MAKTIDEIKRTISYYLNDLYLGVRAEQGIDQTYIDDTFVVPEVRPPHTILRSGIGYEAISAPAEQIITNNPQVEIITEKKGDMPKAIKLAKEINQTWIKQTKRQIPNIFKESVKNLLGRGENYIRILHNEGWLTGSRMKFGLPILFQCPDPMVIYGCPEEDDCGWIPNVGVPNFVILAFPRQPMDLLTRYPDWGNPKARKLVRGEKTEVSDLVEWREYIDKNIHYAEADGKEVFYKPNPYKFVPFVRKYSGFGKRSPEGKLEDLIVSDIRMTRDLIREECAIRSDISSIMHIFAHKPVTIILPPDAEIDETAFRKSFDLSAYNVNLLYLPLANSNNIHWGDTILPSLEAFQYLRDIQGQIRERHPFTMAGFPMGSSGRQQDMASVSAMRRYDTVVENSEDQNATALEMALKIMTLGGFGGLLPDSLTKEDIEIPIEVFVRLKARDPIEEDRLATLGARLFQSQPQIIDLQTCLTKYQNYSQDEAEEIITNILVEKVTFQSPEIAELLGLKAAEKAGILDDLQLLRQRRMQSEQPQGALGQPVPPTTRQRQGGETQTGMGREMIDQALVNRGARQSPQVYTRGG